MKKALLLFSLFMGSVCLFAQTPDFSLVGFGSATTGGAGGTEVTVTSLAQLTTELSTVGKKIIIIDRTFTASGTILEVTSDKTILGVGDKAFLQGIGFHLKNASNVIIRNIKMTMIGGGADDIIGAETTGSATGGNYWIDHCEFFNEYPTLPETAAKKDKYDGMIDFKKSVSNITISWCYFHDHWKCSLIGFSTDKDPYDRKITYHHNWFKNIRSRVPSYRAGTGHVYNNYYDGLNDPNAPVSDGVHSRDAACLFVEGNYFLHYAQSVYWDVNDSPTEAFVNESGATNMYVAPTPANTARACNSFVPPYKVKVDSAANVPAIVMAYAGINKLGLTDIKQNNKPSAGLKTSFILDQNYPNPFNPSTTISFSLSGKAFVTLKIFNAIGIEVASLVSEELSAGSYSRKWNAEGLISGIYFYRLQVGSMQETRKLALLK